MQRCNLRGGFFNPPPGSASASSFPSHRAGPPTCSPASSRPISGGHKPRRHCAQPRRRRRPNGRRGGEPGGTGRCDPDLPQPDLRHCGPDVTAEPALRCLARLRAHLRAWLHTDGPLSESKAWDQLTPTAGGSAAARAGPPLRRQLRHRRRAAPVSRTAETAHGRSGGDAHSLSGCRRRHPGHHSRQPGFRDRHLRPPPPVAPVWPTAGGQRAERSALACSIRGAHGAGGRDRYRHAQHELARRPARDTGRAPRALGRRLRCRHGRSGDEDCTGEDRL